jgi:hypothetical protein
MLLMNIAALVAYYSALNSLCLMCIADAICHHPAHRDEKKEKPLVQVILFFIFFNNVVHMGTLVG